MLSEQKKYEKIWEKEAYRKRSPGENEVEPFVKKCNPQKHETILDVGCGTGRATETLWKRGYINTYGIDIAYNSVNPEIWKQHPEHFSVGNYTTSLLPGYDWIFCCDMLEHLPTDQLEPVLKKIKKESRKGFYLQIPTFKDEAGKWHEELEGEVLHHTVRPDSWWMVLFHDVLGQGVFETRSENRRAVFYRNYPIPERGK